MRRLLDAGVDAIITDRPDVLREVLVSREQWTPMVSRPRTDGLPPGSADGLLTSAASPSISQSSSTGS